VSLANLKHLRTKLTSLEQTNWTKFVLIAAILLVSSSFIIFGIEWLYRGSIHETAVWILQHGPVFALNACLALSVLLLLYGLFGSLVMSVGLTAALLFTISLISYFKVKMIGEPFFPWDVLLDKESMNIFPLVSSAAAFPRIAAIVAVVSAIFLTRFMLPRFSLPLISRAALVLVSMFALYSFGLKTPLASKMLDQAQVNEIVWNQKENYGENGLALAFTLNVKNSIVPKPAGYNEPSIAEIAASYKDSEAGAVNAASTTKVTSKQPNVIFIMSEAFWDPTLLPNVKFSQDPAPTIHQLQKESTSGYLLSPQFGGGTSNVEYEVLTGNSMSFLPGGSVPYQQYINKPLPSLASYFEEQGYKSMAIHSYEGWFWNRNNVYKQLGFESFMSKDQFVNPEYKGFFISDQEVSKQIIKQVDETDRSMFIYAVTMQNHGPYDDGSRYGNNQIQVQGNLTDQAKTALETYTQGVYDADQALKQLIDHYKQSDEPTLIVFYGDHLPMLGLSYDVYKQAGFIQSGNESEWSLEEEKKMHSVTLVTWSNFSMPKQDIPILSDSFLGSNILDALHMEKPVTFAVNGLLASKLPGLTSNLVIDSNQQLSKTVPDSVQDEVGQYREMQYDLLFGDRFLADYVDHDYLTKDSIPNYNMEFENNPMAAQSAAGGK
jgi:phosphoglycerol transferase MdoB-like AlkP superfamily enzyme